MSDEMSVAEINKEIERLQREKQRVKELLQNPRRAASVGTVAVSRSAGGWRPWL